MITKSKRPRSLREVSNRTLKGGECFDRSLREFLDFFYANPRQRHAALKARPRPIDDLKDAYLAATAEHLARSFALRVPAWSDNHGHRLKQPFFAGGLESLKAILIVESPLAFRRRLLFVSKNALSRPRLPSEAA